jgi:hypothetical protein
VRVIGLFDIFSGDAAREAAAAKSAGIQKGYGDLSSLFGQGREALTSSYDQGSQPLFSVFNQSQGGSNAYGDASGANGPEGLARARQNFQAGPGFDFQMNRGIDALTRAGAAKGVATGNTLRDAQEFGSGLAGQEWGNYLSRLQPYLQQGTTAASGIGALGAQKGNALGASFMGQGGAANTAATGTGDANAAASLADYNASKNMWDFGLKAAELGTKAAGFFL